MIGVYEKVARYLATVRLIIAIEIFEKEISKTQLINLGIPYEVADTLCANVKGKTDLPKKLLREIKGRVEHIRDAELMDGAS
jgi:hypothetical protein